MFCFDRFIENYHWQDVNGGQHRVRSDQNTKIIKESISRVWKHNKTICASTPDTFEKNYENSIPLRQQGGSMIILSPNIVHHCSQEGRDYLGRWSWSKINKKKTRIRYILYPPTLFWKSNTTLGSTHIIHNCVGYRK